MTLPLLILHPRIHLKDCKTIASKQKLKNDKKAQPKTKIARTQLTKFAKKISLGLVNKGMPGKLLLLLTCEYNRVQQSCMGCQTSTTSYNISENKRNVVWYNIGLVKSLIAIKNIIQQDTTQYNTIQQGGQTGATIQHQSCMMLFEMCTRLAGAVNEKARHCYPIKVIVTVSTCPCLISPPVSPACRLV